MQRVLEIQVLERTALTRLLALTRPAPDRAPLEVVGLVHGDALRLQVVHHDEPDIPSVGIDVDQIVKVGQQRLQLKSGRHSLDVHSVVVQHGPQEFGLYLGDGLQYETPVCALEEDGARLARGRELHQIVVAADGAQVLVVVDAEDGAHVCKRAGCRRLELDAFLGVKDSVLEFALLTREWP
eukprot:6386470-Prymnesium_polylepis.4